MPFSARGGFLYQFIVPEPPAPAPFPDFPTIPTESEYLAEVSTWSVNLTPVSSNVTTGLSGSGYLSAATASDGAVICGPRATSGNFAKFVVAANSSVTSTSLGTGGGGAPPRHGTIIPSGNVIFTPNNSQNIREYNVVAGTMSSWTPTGGWTANYRDTGNHYMPDGNILCVPGFNTSTGGANKFYRLDPVARTLTDLGRTASTALLHVGGVVGYNGKVYMAPSAATYVLEYDPVANSFTQHSVTGGASGWQGAAVGPSGRIFFFPFDSNDLLIFDPASNTGSKITSVAAAGSSKYGAGKLAQNGNIIVGSNLVETDWLVIDDNANVATKQEYGEGSYTTSNWTMCCAHTLTDHLVFPNLVNHNLIQVIDINSNGVTANALLTPSLQST